MLFPTHRLSVAVTEHLLQHLVAPRPLALASTVDPDGNGHLTPLHCFNLFSAHPPIVLFAPVCSNSSSDTPNALDHLRSEGEVSISIVTRDIVGQAALLSGHYPKGTDPFVKAGFTRKAASLIRPPIVAESVASLECRVKEIKSLGEHQEASQLVIAEVLCLHIDDSIWVDGKIDQSKIAHVARLGGNWYGAITPSNLFTVPKPTGQPGIGIDALPASLRTSDVLTGNHLAQLAGVPALPVKQPGFTDERLDAILLYFQQGEQRKRLHHYAKELLEDHQIEQAWQVLLHT